MSIEISGRPAAQQANVSELSTGASKQKQLTTAQQETGTPSQQDTVSLTDTADMLQRLEEKIRAMPVVDIQRVNTVKSAIDNGNYQIDTTQVAGQLIENEIELYQ